MNTQNNSQLQLSNRNFSETQNSKTLLDKIRESIRYFLENAE